MRFFLFFLVLFLIISCSDNGVQEIPDIKPTPGKIIVTDCTYKKTIENIKVDISYNLKKNTGSIGDLFFYNYPNPFFNLSTFEYELLDPSKIEISVSDLINNKSKVIASYNDKAGFNTLKFSLSNYSDIQFPVLRAYYKIKNVLNDSTNLLYLDATQAGELTNKNRIYLTTINTNDNGELLIPDAYKIWHNQKFPITTENGSSTGYYEIQPSYHLLLINDISGKTTEYNINLSEIEEKGVVLKSN